jgi:beta-glucosidase
MGIGFSLKAQVPYKNSKLPLEERVQYLLSRMTLDEKFWQCFMIAGDFRIMIGASSNDIRLREILKVK